MYKKGLASKRAVESRVRISDRASTPFLGGKGGGSVVRGSQYRGQSCGE